MKHLTAILILLFLFTACGTVRTKPTYLGSEIPLEKKEQKKSVVIRPFLYHDFEFQKLMTTWRHDPKFEQAVLKAFEGSEQFSKISVETFSSDYLGFEREGNEDKVKQIKDHLAHFEMKEKADLYLNVYAKTSQRGYHDGQHKVYLGILHMLSLGLIPMYNTETVNLTIEAYDSNGTFLFSKTSENSRTMYAWLPAILWGGKFGDLNPDESKALLLDGAVRKILGQVN